MPTTSTKTRKPSKKKLAAATGEAEHRGQAARATPGRRLEPGRPRRAGVHFDARMDQSRERPADALRKAPGGAGRFPYRGKGDPRKSERRADYRALYFEIRRSSQPLPTADCQKPFENAYACNPPAALGIPTLLSLTMSGEYQNQIAEGTKIMACKTCSGRKSINCPVCNGQGKLPNGKPCHTCSGDKKVTCPTCHGTGK